MLYDVNSGSLSESLIEVDTLSDTMDMSNMFYNLCQSEEFRKQFTLTLMDLANTCFSKENIDDHIGNIIGLMSEPMKMHNKRFFGVENEELYLNSVSDIRNFLYGRKPYIAQYLKEDFGLAGSLAPIEVEINDTGAGRVIVNTAEVPFYDGTSWCGEYFTDYAITLKAEANMGYCFVGWEENGELISEEENIEVEFGEGGISRKAVFEKINS